MSARIIVPHRGLEHAKTRLSGVLDPAQRADLAEKLLRHVLEEAVSAGPQVVVISPDPALRSLVEAAGAVLSVQHGLGLNAGLAQARDEAIADGVEVLAVLHGDLPALTAPDVIALLDGARGEGLLVALAPDTAGTGTNGLAMTPPDLIGFHFGAGSLESHRRAAKRAGGVDHPRPTAWAGFRHRHPRRPRRLAGGGQRGVIQLVPLDGIPEVAEGDDLGALIAAAAVAAGIGLADDDVVVVTQKVVSKAEGRVVDLASVEPRPQATDWAEQWGRDARQVELVLRESADVVRWADGGLIISRTRHGFVCANAGVDVSNTGRGGEDRATLLPEDPDASARAIRDRLAALSGTWPAVLVTDSFGRPWRDGITDVTIGAAGIDVLADLRGTPDADGRELHATVVAVADELASAADLSAGKSSGRPVVVVRGYRYARPEGDDPGARPLIMDRARNLFS